MEVNYHLSNKYALFYNMQKYYTSKGRDPFEVLPLTFHIKKGIDDPVYY
jgi:tubulin monoglycylase TTLL3/8